MGPGCASSLVQLPDTIEDLPVKRRTAFVCLSATILLPACGGPTSPGRSGPSILLSANVVDPDTVNAASRYNACVGHPYPQPTSPNAAKNYFWPTSTNFSTSDQLALYAGCDGTPTQTSGDTNDPTSVRGATMHLWCDNSSTGLRYFHIDISAGVLGRHVTAGEKLGYAVMRNPGQAQSTAWQFSSNFDVSVINGGDNATDNYFSALSASAFAAWASRGVTSVAQTIVAGAPVCTSYNSNVGETGILAFTPAR